MKVALLTDTHFGARNDSQQFDAFFNRFYTEVFFPYLERTGIKLVIHPGDVFDRRKYINFQILRSCKQYFFTPLKKLGVEMIVIPGNHDTFYKNTNEVNSLDLLLGEYDNITTLQTPTDMMIDRRHFRFIPWICADNYDVCMAALDAPIQDTICVGHFEISGFDMFRGVANHGGMNKEMFAQYPTVLSGHFHHRSAIDNIYYLGSPYEFTWSDYNDPRGFHVFDTETTELTFIENPYKIFHKIYYDDTKDMTQDMSKYKKSCVKVIVTTKTDFQKFDKFIEALYLQEPIDVTVHEDFSDFDSEGLAEDAAQIEDTMTLLSDFVDTIETAENKETLKTLLKTLYVEAQHLES